MHKPHKHSLLKKILYTVETAAFAVTVAAGVIPLELGAPGIAIGSGNNVNPIILFLIPFTVQAFVNVSKTFLLSHLLHRAWPSKIRDTLLKFATKMKSFQNLYKRSLHSIRNRDLLIANGLLFLLGVLPLPTTQIGVFVTATTRYYFGMVPVMLGSAVKIGLAALGSYHGIQWLQGFELF